MIINKLQFFTTFSLIASLNLMATPLLDNPLSKEESKKYLRTKVVDTPKQSDNNILLYTSATLMTLFGIVLYTKRKKSPKINADTALHVDIHSHLIAGIDDGSKSIDESIAMIEKLMDLGYSKIITTPHIMSHRYPNSSEIIKEGLVHLRHALRERSINVSIEVASEYYLDSHFIELIKQDDLLSFGGKYVLFELSYANVPLNLFDTITLIKSKGYTPVLAHPERYGYFHKNYAMYKQLKEAGALFQINLNSLAGYYSAAVQKVVMQLIEDSMVDFIGSDAHKIKHLEVSQKVLNSKAYAAIFEKNTILNATLL